jgi:hypothetical protein
MRSKGLKIAITCLVAVALAAVLWGADLNIKGNVNVQGPDQSNPGNLKVKGNLQVDGLTGIESLAVRGKTAVNNLEVFRILTTTKTLATFNIKDPTTSKSLGQWDFCFLSGIQSGTIGDTCSVTTNNQENVMGLRQWDLVLSRSSLGSSKAECIATCLRFSNADSTQAGS